MNIFFYISYCCCVDHDPRRPLQNVLTSFCSELTERWFFNYYKKTIERYIGIIMSTRPSVFSSVDKMDFLEILNIIKHMKICTWYILYWSDNIWSFYRRFTYGFRRFKKKMISNVWYNLYRSYVIYIMNFRILFMKI